MEFRLFGPSSDTALVTDSIAFPDALAFTDGGAALFVASSSTVEICDTAKGTLTSTNSILDSRNVGNDVRRILPASARKATIVSEMINKWVVETIDFPVPSLSPTPSGFAVAATLPAFAYDGKGSVGIDADGSLRAVSATGTVGTAVALPRFPGTRLDVSPNGTNVAQGSAEGPVRTFVTSGLVLQNTLTGNTSTVNAVRYDHAGTRLFAISVDGSIRVWDPTRRPRARVVRSVPGGRSPCRPTTPR